MSPNSQFQAFVVGVSGYQYYQEIPETASDAKNITDLLIDPLRCGYAPAHVRRCIGATANRDNILNGLVWLAENATPEATTLIYFSGHGGFPEDAPSSIYLCPNDADWRNLPATAIAAEDFNKALATITTGRLVVIVDACHSGGVAAFKGAKAGEHIPQWKGKLPRHFYDKLAQGTGRVILASSQADQESWTYPDSNMSLFTYYLLAGLKGQAAVYNDGLIRVLDLFHYVSESIRIKKPVQQPELAAQNVTMNFPIALYRGGRKWFTPPTAGAIGQGKGESNLVESPLVNIRAQLESPRLSAQLEGAIALEKYAKTLPVATLQTLEVDLQDLEEQTLKFKKLVHDITLYGEDPAWVARCLMTRSYFLGMVARFERFASDEDR